jgi:hypothetical protein
VTLAIVEHGTRYAVAWREGGEECAWVGESASTDTQRLTELLCLAKKDRRSDGREDYEYLSVELAARAWLAAHPDVFVCTDASGYVFDFREDACAFLRAMRAAARAARQAYDVGREWPEWATKALAAGWRPPHGWRP